jgi:NADPH-dependent 2,4-dienoyl-CoA reductase/sulfur reductase-like enzyme
VLDDGTAVPADVVVVGIGTVPATDWLDGSGLVVDNGILCGPDLQAVGAPGVWVAGDAARVRDPRTGASERTEHWTGAREQAVVVARNLTRGAEEPAAQYRSDGYVWSDQHGVRIQHVGRVGAVVREERATRGGRLFRYSEDGVEIGATGLNAQAEILRIRRSLSAAGKQIPSKEARDDRGD